MARIGGVDLDLGGTFRAGAAFRCTEADSDGLVVDVGGGDRVEVRPRDRVAVAFLRAPVETGYFAAHDAAQRALDIVTYLGGPSLSLLAAHDELVQWWSPPENDGYVVRAIVTRPVGITFSAALSVSGPEGRPRKVPAEPQPQWTPALRFFRYAQLAEDVFDAYRNMYLGLEAALSERVQVSGLGERAWLEHVLQELAADPEVDLSRYVSSDASDPIPAFFQQQYEAFRCSTFHAKRGRGSLLPGSVEEREKVTAALGHLAQMVIDLVEPLVGRRRLGGGMTYVGFEGLVIAPKVGNLRMELLRRDGGAVAESVAMSSGYLGPAPDMPGEHVFGGEVPAEPLTAREFDGVRVTAAGGDGFASGPFDETFDFLPIEVTGAEVVQILLTFALTNLQLPRTRFPR